MRLPELHGIRAGVVLYGRDFREGLPNALVAKPLEGSPLYLYKVRQVKVSPHPGIGVPLPAYDRGHQTSSPPGVIVEERPNTQ
jgi:hypothetical protein